MTAFASADGWLVLAFESDGRLLKPKGAVTFTLPASMLDGKKLLLADGSEAAFEISGGKARFPSPSPAPQRSLGSQTTENCNHTALDKTYRGGCRKICNLPLVFRKAYTDEPEAPCLAPLRQERRFFRPPVYRTACGR